ncbi:hypothetical protein MC73_006325 [Proteus mirabilis]|nr:hypothetical protein MC73_006325 [Proteus mirabilis]DAI72693.1 MAG TPA: hypothetical protein [Caudoviricetes sp.]
MKWAKFKGNEITYLVRWIVGIFFLLPISTIYFLLFLIDTPIHFARKHVRQFLFSLIDYIENKLPFKKDR